jgi:hypothetical protein
MVEHKPQANAAPGQAWPGWAKAAISTLLIWHILAVLSVSVAVAPSSPLERGTADRFMAYLLLIDQNHVHRYYSSEPPPTPVVTATLKFGGSRSDHTVRLPDRASGPRLWYQRELALAHHLALNYDVGRQSGDPSRWEELAASYARHLCRTNPGCTAVTVTLQRHLIPNLEQYRPTEGARGGRRLDVESDEFYTTPERLGDFECDAL